MPSLNTYFYFLIPISLWWPGFSILIQHLVSTQGLYTQLRGFQTEELVVGAESVKWSKYINLVSIFQNVC